MGEVDEHGYKYMYLGVLEGAYIMQEMKEKVKSEYLSMVTLVVRSMLYGGNLIKVINA